MRAPEGLKFYSVNHFVLFIQRRKSCIHSASCGTLTDNDATECTVTDSLYVNYSECSDSDIDPTYIKTDISDVKMQHADNLPDNDITEKMESDKLFTNYGVQSGPGNDHSSNNLTINSQTNVTEDKTTGTLHSGSVY